MRLSTLLIGFAFLLLRALPAQSEERLDDWVIEAEAALVNGSDRAALGLVKKVLKARPTDEDALLLGTRAATNLGEYGLLAAWSSDLLAAHETATARRIRAEALRLEGNIAEAIALLAPDLVAAPSNPLDTPSFNLPAAALTAALEAARGADTAAEAIYERIVAEGKRVVVKTAPDLTALAAAYRFFGGRSQAERALIDAKKVDPGFVPALLALGDLYRDVSYLPRDAINEYRLALKARPSLAEARLGMAIAYAQWMKSKEAKEELDRALAINPSLPEGLEVLAGEALGDMKLDEAKGLIAKILAVDGGNPEGLSLLAAWHLLRGEVDETNATLEKVFARDPTFGEAHQILAAVLNERRRWPECLEQMRAAVLVDPKDPRLWDDLAQYAFFLGLEEEGQKALVKADEVAQAGRVWRKNMWTVKRALDRNYVDVRTPHFHHRVHQSERAILEPYLEHLTEVSWALLTQRYRYTPRGLADDQGRILVEHFKDHADFAVRTLGFSSLGALGVCFGPFIAMDSPEGAEGNAWFRTFHHEFAHTITLGITRGRVPRWLTEGLSTHEEKRYEPGWDRGLYRELFDAHATGELFGVVDFDAAFRTSRVIFAYFQGGLTCRYMEERFGFDKVLAMLAAYGEDKNTKTVLQTVLGVSPEDFDEGFRAFVGELLKDVRLFPRVSQDGLTRLDAAITKNPADVESLILLAGALLDRGKNFDAQEAIYKAQSAGSKDPRLDFLLGRMAYAAKKFKTARERFDAAIAAGYEEHTMRLMLAAMLQQEGKAEDALVHLERAVATFPMVSGNASPRLPLARLLLDAGDSDRAVALLEEHVLWTYSDVKTRSELMDIYRGRPSEASDAALMRHLEALVHLTPKTPEVHQELGDLLLKAKQPKRALVEFTVELALLDGDVTREADARAGRALALLDSGGSEALALDEAKKAQSLVDGHPRAMAVLKRLGFTVERDPRK